MVEIAGKSEALGRLVKSLSRTAFLGIATIISVAIFYTACTARVEPHEFGVEQARFGFKTGIKDRIFGPGLYFIPVGSTMHTFPREIHLLEASNDREASLAMAKTPDVQEKVEDYFSRRDRVLGKATHRIIDALIVQTSDGYAVNTDVTLLYSITDPVKVAKDFGWGPATSTRLYSTRLETVF